MTPFKSALCWPSHPVSPEKQKTTRKRPSSVCKYSTSQLYYKDTLVWSTGKHKFLGSQTSTDSYFAGFESRGVNGRQTRLGLFMFIVIYILLFLFTLVWFRAILADIIHDAIVCALIFSGQEISCTLKGYKLEKRETSYPSSVLSFCFLRLHLVSSTLTFSNKQKNILR